MREIYLVLLPFINPLLIYKIQVALSLYNLSILSLMENSLHDSQICWIIWPYSYTFMTCITNCEYFLMIWRGGYHCLFHSTSWYWSTTIGKYIPYLRLSFIGGGGIKNSQNPHIQATKILLLPNKINLHQLTKMWQLISICLILSWKTEM